MNFIYRSQLPKSEAEVRADLAAWIAEVEAHKGTVGVPAPFPEYELLRHLGPGFVVLEDEDYAPPSEVSPDEESPEQAVARLKAELDAIERAEIMPRQTRELNIRLAEFFASQEGYSLEEDIVYQKLVEIDTKCKKIREKINEY